MLEFLSLTLEFCVRTLESHLQTLGFRLRALEIHFSDAGICVRALEIINFRTLEFHVRTLEF